MVEVLFSSVQLPLPSAAVLCSDSWLGSTCALGTAQGSGGLTGTLDLGVGVKFTSLMLLTQIDSNILPQAVEFRDLSNAIFISTFSIVSVSPSLCPLYVEICFLYVKISSWILPIKSLQKLPHEKSMLCNYLYCKESSELPLN